MCFQFEFDFTGENAKAFDEGLATGRSWDVNWYPGGPWFVPGDTAGKQRNTYYLEGFGIGLQENFATNPDFKQWFFANKHPRAAKYPGANKS